ncbi:DUF5688 family protein [Butyrivibrio sp. M55]|uniref:DUF5688 family protein n=1 Tax=Butyrivibrio sp. M55 TaxID=1855323 RepID=UPI0008EA1EDB|nr:DUF5688 family protein [Butyrivibrio sp. M55]SFU87580.1 hypothetical protein SAMN05216540_11610 [Butyrivibrio sp. M55]
MDFEQFKEKLADEIKELLSSLFGRETTIEARTVEKTNTTYDALTIKPIDSDVAVNINATHLFELYEKGEDFGVIASDAAKFADNALYHSPDFDIDSVKDYGQMKERLTMEVISAEKNADLLKSVPHKEIEDLAVVYRLELAKCEQGVGTVLVTNQMIEHYGITAEQLHEDALANAPKFKPLVIETMAEVLSRQMGIEDVSKEIGLDDIPKENRIYVASVEGYVNGAGALAYQDFMEKAAERANGSFFILPSSIHELLIIPDTGKHDLHDLESMVREVNATTVDPKEQLTDNVYHYDAKDKIFELGEKFVARQNNKEVKKSLSAQIKAKKEEIAKAPKKDEPVKEPKAKEGRAK